MTQRCFIEKREGSLSTFSEYKSWVLEVNKKRRKTQ